MIWKEKTLRHSKQRERNVPDNKKKESTNKVQVNLKKGSAVKTVQE